MKQLLSISLVIISLHSYCQEMGFRNGLIVTQNSDTIYCLVPINSSFGNKIHIKKSADSDEEVMLLSNIKYLANGSNVYENITYKKKDKEIHKLMWLEIEGKINLYLEIITNIGTSTTSSGGTFTRFSAPTKTYVIKKEDSTYLIESKNFKETISPLISDNENLIYKVETKKYTIDNIEDLIKEYNASTNTN